MTVSGAGSSVSTGTLWVGRFDEGSLTVSDGGQVLITNPSSTESSAIGFSYVGSAAGANGEALITGAGSELEVGTFLHVGHNGVGNVLIENGGSLITGADNPTTVSARLAVAWNSTSGGSSLTVTGTGSSVTVGENLVVGNDAAGTMTVSDNASVVVAAGTTVGEDSSLTITTGGSLETDSVDVASGGTLSLGTNGILTAANTTIASGGTLKGAGSISGTATIQGGGTFAPGNSIGIQAVENIVFDDASVFEWEMNYAAGDEGLRGTNYDAVDVGGTISGSGDAVFKIVLPASTTFADSFWAHDRSWSDIFSGGDASVGNWTDFFGPLAFFNSTGEIDSPIAATQGSFTLSGATLSWQAIPEPSTALAGLLLAAGLMRRRRSGCGAIRG
jgi:T5SS/PEP-CTERM-associated repeat protein